MKVSVDDNRCQGHTLCAMAAPEVFELSDDDGHASVAAHADLGRYEEQVREAEAACPERAIIIAP